MNTLTISILGSVNSGKSTLFDKIVGVDSVQKEYGSITQKNKAISITSQFLAEKWPRLRPVLGLLRQTKLNLVDTPGHTLFKGLQQRSILVSDVLVLVYDSTSSWPSENTRILRSAIELKKPVIIAINKIDKTVKTTETNLRGELEANSLLGQKLYEVSDEITSAGDIDPSIVETIADGFKRVAPGGCMLCPISAGTCFGIRELLALAIISSNVEESTNKQVGFIFDIEWMSGETWYTIFVDHLVSVGERYYIGDVEIRLKRLKLDVYSKGRVDSLLVKSAEKTFLKCIIESVSEELFQPGSEISIERSVLSDCISNNSELVSEGIMIKCKNHGELEGMTSELKNLKIPVMTVSFGVLTTTELIVYEAKADNKFKLILSTDEALVKNAKPSCEVITEKHIPHLLVKLVDWHRLRSETDLKCKRLESVSLPGVLVLIPTCVFKSDPLIVGCSVCAGEVKRGDTVVCAGETQEFKIKGMQSNNSPLNLAVFGETCAIEFKDISKEKRLLILQKLKSSEEVKLINRLKTPLIQIQDILNNEERILFDKAVRAGWHSS